MVASFSEEVSTTIFGMHVVFYGKIISIPSY